MKHLVVVLIFFVISSPVWSGFTLTGTVNPSTVNITTTTAGVNPTSILFVNDQSQYVQYSWTFNGSNTGDSTTFLMGSINVKSSRNLPNSLTWTIKALDANKASVLWNNLGVSTGDKLLSTTKQTLVQSIWSTSNNLITIFWGIGAQNITRYLNQTLQITDFASLHCAANGSEDVINLTISYTLE